MTEFFEALIDWDKCALLFVNGMHTSFWDGFMYWISDKWIWIPFYAAMLWPIIKRRSWATIPAAVAIALCVVFADQFASGFCKPFFERFRPSYDPEIGDMVHIVAGGRGGAYGFISSHAANTFAVATFTVMLFRNWQHGVVVGIWALLNCYSRMYLGYHFPLDLICGALAGAAIGALCYLIYMGMLKVWPAKLAAVPLSPSFGSTDFAHRDFAPMTAIFALSIFYISLFASYGFIV